MPAVFNCSVDFMLVVTVLFFSLLWLLLKDWQLECYLVCSVSACVGWCHRE